jgi:hypothetical protein
MSPLRRTFAMLVVGACASALFAAEVTVRNDSFESGQSAVIVGDFVVGEEAAVRLTAPCDGNIVAVQIGWLASGAAQSELQEAIHIYKDGAWPTPGPLQLTLEAPQLTPGALNEFRYSDEANTVPISIPVLAGSKFIVSLEFGKATDIRAGTPSVFRDVDGCTSGVNALYAPNLGGWLDFCLLLKGDLVIRAVIDCDDAPGACCLPDGTCDFITANACADAGGTFQGIGVDCGGLTCPEPLGPCCIEATQGCVDLTFNECATAGGVWGPAGASCNSYVCFPSGACCLPDGTCADGVSPDECAAQEGVFQGDGTSCAMSDCPPPVGACCLPNGNCLLQTLTNCGALGGDWLGFGTDCSDGNGDGAADDCAAGVPGDMNCDGLSNLDDIDPFVLALISASEYAAQYPGCAHTNGDMNGDDAVNLDDIDGFISALIGS